MCSNLLEEEDGGICKILVKFLVIVVCLIVLMEGVVLRLFIFGEYFIKWGFLLFFWSDGSFLFFVGFWLLKCLFFVIFCCFFLIFCIFVFCFVLRFNFLMLFLLSIFKVCRFLIFLFSRVCMVVLFNLLERRYWWKLLLLFEMFGGCKMWINLLNLI